MFLLQLSDSLEKVVLSLRRKSGNDGEFVLLTTRYLTKKKNRLYSPESSKLLWKYHSPVAASPSPLRIHSTRSTSANNILIIKVLQLLFYLRSLRSLLLSFLQRLSHSFQPSLIRLKLDHYSKWTKEATSPEYPPSHPEGVKRRSSQYERTPSAVLLERSSEN